MIKQLVLSVVVVVVAGCAFHIRNKQTIATLQAPSCVLFSLSTWSCMSLMSLEASYADVLAPRRRCSHSVLRRRKPLLYHGRQVPP